METTTKYHPLISIFLSDNELLPALMVPAVRGGYVWATNGHAAIRIDRDVIADNVAQVEKYPDVQTVFNNAINSTALTGTIKAERLGELLGKLPTYPTYKDCPECEGDKKVTCNCCGNETDCDECNGTGHTDEIIGREFSYDERINVGKQAFSPRILQLISKVMQETGEKEADLYQHIDKPYALNAALVKFLRVQVLMMPMYVEYPEQVKSTLKID
jgi:hypothetical protein